MDYYQKYQKYRFKYLNLLNQSGGTYTLEEFKEILEKKTEDDFKIWWDWKSEDFEIWNVEDFENFYKIFSSFDENKKIIILSTKLPLTNYRATNIISDEEFTAIIRYYEICLEAVKKNGLLLKKLNEEISNLLFRAVTVKNIPQLDEVHSHEEWTANQKMLQERRENNKRLNDLQFRYLQICIEAVRQNTGVLEYIKNMFPFYQSIINIINYHYKFYIKLKNFKKSEEYSVELKKNIIFNKDNNFKTKEELLEIEKYFEICTQAVNNYPLLLKDVILNNFKTTEDYYTICLEAVEKNGLALEHVKYLNSNKNSKYYFKISFEAIIQNVDALQFVNDMFIRSFPEEYRRIQNYSSKTHFTS
jgi:hypothetical protein